MRRIGWPYLMLAIFAVADAVSIILDIWAASLVFTFVTGALFGLLVTTRTIAATLKKSMQGDFQAVILEQLRKQFPAMATPEDYKAAGMKVPETAANKNDEQKI